MGRGGVLHSGSRRHRADRRPCAPWREEGRTPMTSTTVLAIALLLAMLVIDRLAR
jgi:hypothetical protein